LANAGQDITNGLVATCFTTSVILSAACDSHSEPHAESKDAI